jgi:mannose-6-phosphate isomerase-like protein (cupin superfamily)
MASAAKPDEDQKNQPQKWRMVSMAELPAVACPCGEARRAFHDLASYPATVHLTEISADARRHYHRRLTETYYILECGPEAAMELDDARLPIRPGDCIVIPPGVRHRAVGQMRVLIFVLPKFDPADEWFD